jgi:pimeloyl-ACP methyl ester carboxylesterase
MLTYRDLHVATSGPPGAPPVVLLHGWGSSAKLMEPLAKSLEDAFRVYNVDLPGHGESPLPPSAVGVPECADLVVGLIEGEIGQPVPLVGHSNGGRISLYIASHADLKRHASRLALISPSGITPPRSAKYHVKKTTAKVLKAPFEILPGPMREFGLDWLRHSLVWKALGSSDYRALHGVMRETFVKTVGFHLDEQVAGITAPTLLFWGDRDTAVSRVQMETLERLIPDAGLVGLEGAGHYGYLDQPEIVEAGLREFLGEGVPA